MAPGSDTPHQNVIASITTGRCSAIRRGKSMVTYCGCTGCTAGGGSDQIVSGLVRLSAKVGILVGMIPLARDAQRILQSPDLVPIDRAV